MTADSHPELPLDPDTPPLHVRPSALAWVFAGGALGTGLRYGLEELWPSVAGDWPWATFVINLCGAFVLGVLLESLARRGADDGWRLRARLFGGTGLCGAFTTYSTFALEISLLGRDHAYGLAVGYAVVSVVAGVVLAWSGIVVAERLSRSRA